MTEQITPLYQRVIATLYPVLDRVTIPTWLGSENIPQTGGFVAAANHVSSVDHFPLAHFLVAHGRAPHFLAKSALFEPPLVRQIMHGTEQIPVYRGTSQAATAFSAAIGAIERGACVCIYPEGTITREPEFWPMAGKSGAARIALETGCPLVPIAMWGTREIHWPYVGARVPKLWPPKPVTVRAGAPVDLADLRGRPVDQATLAEATDRLMTAITQQLEMIRGEQAPHERYNPRAHRDQRGGTVT